MALYNRPRQKSPRQQQRQQKPTPSSHETPPIDLEAINSHWPPVEDFSGESPQQRDERLAREHEAKRINDEIDAQIEIEKSERRKRRPDLRIILLGQAESGKSTILRNFQLKYAPSAFHAEAAAWRAVIDLNLIRSVTFLLNLLDLEEGDAFSGPSTSTNPSASTSAAAAAAGSRSSSNGSGGGDGTPLSPSGAKLVPLQRLTDDLRRLRVSLSPLRRIEESLARFISPDHPRRVLGSGDWSALPTERAFEVSVRSGSRWKSFFKGGGGGLGGAALSKANTRGYEEVQNARRVIEACREDIVALWNHPAIRASLEEQSVSLEFQSGFFLDAVDRIATPGYEPSSADILKARIQTVGVEEHALRMEIARSSGAAAQENGQLWSIIDVGGSRYLRAAWLPYFDDVNMLLFIAPVSAFNQTLVEDRSVNRLWDSFLLWKSLCVHKSLKQATFVLLLNKCDILDAKLRAGIKFRQYVTSYKDRPNNTESVLQYLKGKFSALYKEDPENTQPLHIHRTCATDSDSTSVVLARIRELIYTGNLVKANLL
ncbi:guanine nucleotide binding protein, alpha subunit [Russula dissimulans]|nr:guanine nucleotide binding protein, alpha subunit [Russula dissimulans]